MEYLNMWLSHLDQPEYVSATDRQRSVYWSLMKYCCRVENGGRIAGCKDWPAQIWQRTAQVQRSSVLAPSPLWRWEGPDLVVFAYSDDVERMVRTRRKAGRSGGLASGRSRSEANSETCFEATPDTPETAASTEGKEGSKEEREVMEGKEERHSLCVSAHPDSQPTGLNSSDPEPSLLPKTREAALAVAEKVGCPVDFATLTWNKVVSRGGRDAKNVPIRDWEAYLASEWSMGRERYQRQGLSASPQALTPPTSHLTPQNVPLWRQIKATEALLESVKKEIMAISVPSRTVFPEEHVHAMAKRQPLVARKAELEKQLKKLTEQAAQAPAASS